MIMISTSLVLSNLLLNLASHRIHNLTSADEQSERTIQKAIISMKLIVCEIDSFIHTHASALQNAWPDIWQWITLIHRQCIVEKKYGKALQNHSLRAIPACIITALCRQYEPGLHFLISHTSGIFELITPLWLREDVDDSSHLIDNAGYAANFGSTLNFLLPLDHDLHLLALIVESAE
jgi:hypothetical protein